MTMKTSSKKWQKIRKIKGLRQFVTWYPRHVSENPGYYGKLSDIISNLPFQFVCISKSYIVNIKCIKSWKSDAVLLKNGMEISIAQSKRASFKQAVFNYGRSKEVI